MAASRRPSPRRRESKAVHPHPSADAHGDHQRLHRIDQRQGHKARPAELSHEDAVHQIVQGLNEHGEHHRPGHVQQQPPHRHDRHLILSQLQFTFRKTAGFRLETRSVYQKIVLRRARAQFGQGSSRGRQPASSGSMSPAPLAMQGGRRAERGLSRHGSGRESNGIQAVKKVRTGLFYCPRRVSSWKPAVCYPVRT